MAENSIWKKHLEKIWSLFEQGGEMRTQAYSLLDALLDSLLDAGEISQLDRLFEGIEITKDGLTIPVFIREEVEKVRFSRWNKTPFYNAIRDCRLIETYELYFRAYPEQIQQLPPFLCLEACTHVPSFCGPDSPVRGLGLIPPVYDLAGIDKYPNIERVHFYSSVPTFIRYPGLSTFTRSYRVNSDVSMIQKAAEKCCQTLHVRHVFAEKTTVEVSTVANLLSTNLTAKDKSIGTVEYVSKPRRVNRNPLLETVSTTIHGQKEFVVDATGLTSGNLEEHPHLVIASNLLDNLEGFLSHKTPSKYLEVSRGVKEQIERVSFFLDDNVDAPVSERVLAIEAENGSDDVNKLLKSARFPNCTQITVFSDSRIYNFKLNIHLDLSKDFLERYPSLEAVSVSANFWGHKGKIVVHEDIWDCVSPLNFVAFNLYNRRTGIGFCEATKGTLRERLLSWQESLKVVLQHKEYISSLSGLYLHEATDIALILPYIPNIQKLVPYPKTLPSSINGNVKRFSEQERRVHFDEVYKYRIASMRTVTSMRDVQLVAARQALAHRASLNRKPSVSASVHHEIEQRMLKDREGMSAMLSSLSRGSKMIKLGYTMYLETEKGWVRRNHIYIDEEYTKRRWNSKWLNLDLAFKVRDFSSSSLKRFSKFQLNTPRVTMMDLASCDSIRSLRIDRPLSIEEWSVLGTMTHVESLYIAKEVGLSEIPDEVCALTNLRELYLPNHEISQVPEGIKSLTKLEKMSLRGNPIGVESLTLLITYLETLPQFYKLYFDTDSAVSGFSIV